MTTIEDDQRGLLALLKGRPPVQPSAYLDEAAESHGLQVLRWITLSWREFHVQASCPLTSGLLRWQGTWRREIDAFNADEHPSAAVEDLRDAFLERHARGEDPPAAPLAALERALVATTIREAATVEIPFRRDPRHCSRRLRAATRWSDGNRERGASSSVSGGTSPSCSPSSRPATLFAPPASNARPLRAGRRGSARRRGCASPALRAGGSSRG